MQQSSSANKSRRGIYLLPNLLTTAALFSGFYAIIAAIDKQFTPAAIAIFIAMILDGVDGRIARLTNTQSDFGLQYDSLSDIVSFGLAPALVMHQWAFFSLGKPGWLAAFVYAAAAALRLARFNAQASSQDRRFFQGLPSPAAAAVLAGMVWLTDTYSPGDLSVAVIYSFPVTILLSILMVSNIRYYSFKQFDLKGRVPFISVLIIVALFTLIAIEPSLVLLVLAMGYALSGPIWTLFALHKHRQARRTTETQTGESGERGER